MQHSATPQMLAVLLAYAASIGCNEDGYEGGDDEVSDETDGPPDRPDHPDEVCKSTCRECEGLMKDAYACMAFDEFDESLSGFSCIVCDNDGSGSAAVTCGTQASLQSFVYATMEAQVIACDNTLAANCAGWDPSLHVRAKRVDEWDVDRALIEALVADPSQLVGCDGGRVRLSGGAYHVTSLDSDDLLSRLGLMNGDVIQSINGYALSGPFEVAEAFFNLWPGTNVFVLEALRPGVGSLTLSYELV